MKTHLLLIAFLISMYSTAQVYVDASATGANDGTSWTDAYTDLQNALNNNPTSAFWVKAGTYIPGSSRTDSFTLTNNQEIYGGFNGTEVSVFQRDPEVNPTILSGDINGNDNMVFSTTDPNRSENSYRIVEINGGGVVIDGFSINNGNANGNATSQREGSAVNVNAQGSVEINNCKFFQHTLNRGGVIRSIDTNNSFTDIEITNSIFKDNESSFGTVYYGRANGTINIIFEGCLFTKNTSVSSTGSLIWLRQDISGSQFAEIINSTFSDNNLDSSRAVIDKINTSGGSVVVDIYNSIFWNNGDNFSGTFSDAVESNTNGSVSNSISNNNFASSSSTTNVSNANPLFTDPVNGDYTLQSGSPAIDAGDNQYTTLTTDLAGNTRIVNTTVDMGPYEFGTSSTDTTPPTVITQNINVSLDASGNATIMASDIDNGSTDNSSGQLNYSLDISIFDCSNIGANPVILTVTDPSGNSATGTATVTVVDDLAPSIAGINLQGVSTQCPITVQTIIPPTVTDNCAGTVTGTTVTTGTISSNTTITWTFDDGNGNTSSLTQAVVVNDTTDPTITGVASFTADLNGQPQVVVDLSTDLMISTSDNCNGTVSTSLSTPNVFNAVGNYNITVIATDAAGNTDSITIPITVTDSTASNDDIKSLQARLYPNPATTEFTVELDQEQIDQIAMYNLQGQLVKTSSSDRVNISDLTSGIYLVKVTSTSGATATQKLIKK